MKPVTWPYEVDNLALWSRLKPCGIVVSIHGIIKLDVAVRVLRCIPGVFFLLTWICLTAEGHSVNLFGTPKFVWKEKCCQNLSVTNSVTKSVTVASSLLTPIISQPCNSSIAAVTCVPTFCATTSLRLANHDHTFWLLFRPSFPSPSSSIAIIHFDCYLGHCLCWPQTIYDEQLAMWLLGAISSKCCNFVF